MILPGVAKGARHGAAARRIHPSPTRAEGIAGATLRAVTRVTKGLPSGDRAEGEGADRTEARRAHAKGRGPLIGSYKRDWLPERTG
jgi:hypothetical protein